MLLYQHHNKYTRASERATSDARASALSPHTAVPTPQVFKRVPSERQSRRSKRATSDGRASSALRPQSHTRTQVLPEQSKRARSVNCKTKIKYFAFMLRSSLWHKHLLLSIRLSITFSTRFPFAILCVVHTSSSVYESGCRLLCARRIFRYPSIRGTEIYSLIFSNSLCGTDMFCLSIRLSVSFQFAFISRSSVRSRRADI